MHSPDDWYRSFFHGIALDLWRNYATPEVTRSDTDSLLKHLQLSPPARILDVPCGNARISLELATRAFQVVGIDIAAESIAEGKAEAEKRGLDVELHQGDMRELNQFGIFDGVCCWGNSFGYLTEEGNAAFLRAAAAALKPGGRLVIEFGTLAETLLHQVKERTWYQVGDIILAIHNEYDLARGRLLTTYHFIRDGKDDVRRGSQQLYLYRELAALLRSAGFDEVTACNHDGSPLKLGGQRAIIVAQRAG